MDIPGLLIPIHITTGALALLAGAVALAAKKGLRWHRLGGKVFFYAMLVSALTSCVVAVLPGHVNYFLFAIGLFSSYFLLSGYRSLSYRSPPDNLIADHVLAMTLVALGIGMIALPLITTGNVIVVLSVFGMVGIVFGIRDVRMLRDPEILRRRWLSLHLGKMTGGYIAATTAFFVVNEILPGLLNWFVPGLIGGAFIAYWINRVGDSESAEAQNS